MLISEGHVGAAHLEGLRGRSAGVQALLLQVALDLVHRQVLHLCRRDTRSPPGAVFELGREEPVVMCAHYRVTRA